MVRGQDRQEGPVADVIDAVGHIPEEIGQTEDDDKAPTGADVGKEQHRENGAEDAAYQDGGLEFAPGGTDIVDEQADDGIVEGIEDSHDGEDHTGGAKDPQGKLQHIGEKMEQGIGLKGVEHIPANGAQAEVKAVAVVQLIHGIPPQ